MNNMFLPGTAFFTASTYERDFFCPCEVLWLLVCHFLVVLGKVYHKASISDCWPDLEIRNFSPEGQLSQGRNVYRLKTRWLSPHCQWILPSKVGQIENTHFNFLHQIFF